MYAIISLPFLSLTLATLRLAEFGFLGLTMSSLRTVPFFCGLPLNAGVLVLNVLVIRVFFLCFNWFSVIIIFFFCYEKCLSSKVPLILIETKTFFFFFFFSFVLLCYTLFF